MLVLKNGNLVDPARGKEFRADVAIDTEAGIVIEVGEGLAGDETLDCGGLHVFPGFIDLCAHFHDPGRSGRESIANGVVTAAHGGFTGVALRPDTTPPIDNAAAITYIKTQADAAGGARVYPTGTITKRGEGGELAEMGRMSRAGAVGFSDGGRTLASAVLLYNALQYASMFDKTIFDVPQNPELAEETQMHEGEISARSGMHGLPRVAEVIQVGRDVRLADAASGKLHLHALSTREGLKIIRSAREHGVKVSADVSPVHLKLTVEKVLSFDPAFKTFPPLRESTDIAALKKAYMDGVIDCVSSNHEPLTAEEEGVEFLYAPFGASTLEAAVGVIIDVFYHEMKMPAVEIARRQSVSPAEILGVPHGGFSTEDPADFTIIDLEREWTVEPSRFKSRGRNCPLSGMKLKGGPVYALVGGVIHPAIAGD